MKNLNMLYCTWLTGINAIPFKVISAEENFYGKLRQTLANATTS